MSNVSTTATLPPSSSLAATLWTLDPRVLDRLARRMSGPEDDDGDIVLERDPKVGRARRYCVIFYNDDYTSKWFVVHVLEQFFHMNETMATAFMMAVHNHGKGVAGVYTRDIAETKATMITDYARACEVPLMVTSEPEDVGSE